MTSCKRTPWFILVILSLFPQLLHATPAEDTPTKWSVQSAVSYALSHNPDTRAALERIAAADADLKAARSAFYPQLDIGLEYNRTNNPMYSFGNILNQGVFKQKNMDFNDPGTTDSLQAKAMLQYRFYNGGRDQAGVDAAQNLSLASGHQNKATRLQLEYSVVRAFCRIVQAGEVIAARQSALKAMTASLAVARARYDEGSLLQEEVLNLEVQQARAQEQLIRAEHSLRLAQRGFLRLLGLKQGPVVLNPQASPVQEIPGDSSIENRAELKALHAQIQMLAAKVRQARGGYKPTADLFGSYQVEKGSTLDEGSGNSWAAGVRLNYTLFNGGRTSAEVERAEAQLREAKEQLHKLELAFNLEKEQALLSLNQEEQRLKVTQKMVRSARESARLSRLRFTEGIVLSSELIETENRLTDALLSHSLARASRKIAIADLRRAVGLHQFFQGE
nr:TolC family protein [uncultured Desulfobulbus sp.]